MRSITFRSEPDYRPLDRRAGGGITFSSLPVVSQGWLDGYWDSHYDRRCPVRALVDTEYSKGLAAYWEDDR